MPTETLRAEPDSSTHRSLKRKRKRKSRQKERRKHSKKKKRSERSPSVSSGSKDITDDVDKPVSESEGETNEESDKGIEELDEKFELDIKPLEEYLPDVKALYKEIFTLVNKKEFKKMLPENLKKYDPREVRKWCLDEMEGISVKRLKAILCGKPMTSSSSESEAANSDSEKTVTAQEKSQKELEVDKSTAPIQDTLVSEQQGQDFSILAELSKSPNETEIDELLVGEENPTLGVENVLSEAMEKTGETQTGKSESKAEILELELRARALQSFLKYQEKRQQQQTGTAKE